MNTTRSSLFLGLLGLSAIMTYQFVSSGDSKSGTTTATPESSTREAPSSSRTDRNLKPLLLDEPREPQIDPTNYEVTVSDLTLQPIGLRIEGESRARLQELTARYQLSVNQRRETFPLIVSHHPDHMEGLVVNGFTSTPPDSGDFSTQFSEILNLTQRELFQEDLGADRAWWREILTQIRDHHEAGPLAKDPGDFGEGSRD